MEFRTGVNLGDLMVDGELSCGDGVIVDGAKAPPLFFQRTAKTAASQALGLRDGMWPVDS
jgi:hypothetical protein